MTNEEFVRQAYAIAGGTIPFVASRFAIVDEMDVIPGAQVGWASSDTRIAIVDNTGRVFGIAEGTVVITATSSNKAGTASVRVKK